MTKTTSSGRHTLITREQLNRAVVGSLVLIVPLAILALVGVATGGPFQRTAIELFITMTIVVGIGTFSGNSGILSFGHAAFVCIGAYLGGIFILTPDEKQRLLPNLPDLLTNASFSLPIALVATAILVVIISIPTGFVMVKMTTSAAVIGTFALLVVTNSVVVNAKDFTGGNQTFFGLPPVATILSAFTLVCVAIACARLYKESAFGLRLRAARENQLAARAIGIKVTGQRLIAWSISAVLCALGGALLGAFIGAFSPKTFYLALTFQLLAMLLVGGWKTVSGAVVGVVGVTMLTRLLDSVTSSALSQGVELFGVTQLGIGVVILAVLIFRRDGIMGRREIEEYFYLWKTRKSQAVAPVAALNDPGHLNNSELTISDVTKSFGSQTVLDGISVQLRTNEILGVIGPNGSGKTTLVNIVTGMLRADIGQITLDGTDITHFSPEQIARTGIARTFQNIRIFRELSVLQNLQAVHTDSAFRIPSTEQSRALLELVGLLDKADTLAGELDHGSQRKLEIARALVSNPHFLFLDEPAAGLNEEESDELMRVLRFVHEHFKLGILIIDHDLRLMTRVCSRLVAIDQGKVIADGSPQTVTQHDEVIRSYLGTLPTHTKE